MPNLSTQTALEICSNCERPGYLYSYTIDNHSQRVCESCACLIGYCYACSTPVFSDRAVREYNRYFCSQHSTFTYAACDDCGDSVNQYFLERINRRNICGPCADENYGECDNCGRYTRLNGESTCSDCGDYHTFVESTTFIQNPSHRKVGFEIEFFSREEPAIRSFGIIKDDGSIRDYPEDYEPAEFASQVSNGDALLNIIDTVCSRLHDAGADVNRSCGLHIHLDIRENNEAQKENIRKWWKVFEKIFFAVCSPSRRRNTFTVPVEGVSFSEWSHNRYHALNIMAEEAHGTYEVRLHQGSINAEKIKNWVLLLLNFFDIFQDVPSTSNRITRVKNFSDRERILFFYNSLKLPLKLRKYFVKRIREFDREALPILNLSKNRNIPLESTTSASPSQLLTATYNYQWLVENFINDDWRLAT